MDFLFGLATGIASALVFVMIVGATTVRRIAVVQPQAHAPDCECRECDPSEAWRKWPQEGEE